MLFPLSACLLLAAACPAFAQTLAHPGWTASGFNADPWWKHAVFYEVKQSTEAVAYVGPAPPSAMDWANDPNQIASRLDALQSLGIDGLILPMPAQQPANAAPDNFDDLMRQASQRGIHILLRFPASGTDGDPAAKARLWLGRGVSGFYIANSPQGAAGDIQTMVPILRRITNTAVGGRIVIADLPLNPGGAAGHRGHNLSGAAPGRAADPAAPQLQVDARESLPPVPDAASLRRLLEEEPSDAAVLIDLQRTADASGSPDPYASLWKAIAAISLTTHPDALIDADAQLSQSAGDTSSTLAEWYRQLIALHRGNATLRYGSATALDFDAQDALVWVSRASAGTGLAAPVVVACNLTSSPIYLYLGPAMKSLNLHGSFLRTLLRTDAGMGPQDLNWVAVPAYGVYIGELHR